MVKEVVAKQDLTRDDAIRLAQAVRQNPLRTDWIRVAGLDRVEPDYRALILDSMTRLGPMFIPPGTPRDGAPEQIRMRRWQ